MLFVDFGFRACFASNLGGTTGNADECLEVCACSAIPAWTNTLAKLRHNLGTEHLCTGFPKIRGTLLGSSKKINELHIGVPLS